MLAFALASIVRRTGFPPSPLNSQLSNSSDPAALLPYSGSLQKSEDELNLFLLLI